MEIGQRFTRLVITSIDKKKCNCVCDCGNEIKKYISDVIKGNHKSCGCLGRQRLKEHREKHFLTGSPTYNSWENMTNRCNTNSVQHKNSIDSYKNVTICEQWKGRGGFQIFYNEMGDRPEGKTLDRIDNELGYFKENCRWATKQEQQNNRRVCKKYQFRGSLQTIAEIMKVTNLSYMIVWHRLNKGKSW